MGIETGSPNASRLPGVYVYPLQSYNNQAIAPVSRVSQASRGALAQSSVTAPSFEKTVKEERFYLSDPKDEKNRLPESYENTAYYSNAALYKKGLFLNIRV